MTKMVRSLLLTFTIVLSFYFDYSLSQPITNSSDTSIIEISDDNITSSTKIVGGNSAPGKNNWPWMAVLLYSGVVNCGGILISDSHILTAAHCAGGDGDSPNQVRLGDYDLQYSETGEQTLDISWIKLHENYNKEIDGNDIAIIKMKKPVIFSKSIQAAELVEPGYFDPASSYGIASGWGDTRSGGQISNVLLEVRVEIWSNAECSNQYEKIGDTILDTMLCAGSPGRDTCQGDSGGPLNCPVTKFKPGESQYKICGITSWGAGCGNNGYPGVYTRVTEYLDWIDEHTNKGYSNTSEDYSNTNEDYSNTNEDYSNVEGSGSEESVNCDDEDDCFDVEIEYTDKTRDFPARDFADRDFADRDFAERDFPAQNFPSRGR